MTLEEQISSAQCKRVSECAARRRRFSHESAGICTPFVCFCAPGPRRSVFVCVCACRFLAALSDAPADKALSCNNLMRALGFVFAPLFGLWP